MRLTRADLLRDLRTRVFRPTPGRRLFGMEVEFLPLNVATEAPVPVVRDEPEGPATGCFIERFARPRGWTAAASRGGAPAYRIPGGGAASFEPGGQLEVSSPPSTSVDDLVAWLDGVVEPLRREALRGGMQLVARGFDPVNPAAVARLRSCAPRYVRMTHHYDRIGPWGRRMMRQSAAIHVNVDLGSDPLRSWSVANRVAPWLLALFANSPRADGRDTGHRSWRAAQWRRLDPSRTGVFPSSAEPIEAYLEFALQARAFLLGDSAPAEPFERWLERGVSREAWRAHLSTLFPEVRPRGYLEFRGLDALPPRWFAVPAVVVGGLLYDDEARARVERSLPAASPELLERAGRLGVHDPTIRRGVLDVMDIALAGARRLPRAVISEESLRRAHAYRARFPAAGRDPGDDTSDHLTRAEVGAQPPARVGEGRTSGG